MSPVKTIWFNTKLLRTQRLVSDARRNVRLYTTIKDRKTPLQGSRPSVPHGTNFLQLVPITAYSLIVGVLSRMWRLIGWHPYNRLVFFNRARIRRKTLQGIVVVGAPKARVSRRHRRQSCGWGGVSLSTSKRPWEGTVGPISEFFF